MDENKKKQVKRLSSRQSFVTHNYCNKMECGSCPLAEYDENNKRTCESMKLQDQIIELEFEDLKPKKE